MYQTIREKISVSGVYEQASFRPVAFLWKNRRYLVDKITLFSDIKDGGVQQRWYAIQSGGSIYRLLFNRDQETWILEELWCE